MSLKTKLTSLITTFVLLCSLLTVGVFAVKNTTFNVGGDIVFNVQGIEADIELTANGVQNAEFNNDEEIGKDVLKKIEIRNNTSADSIAQQFAKWSNLDMTFAEGQSTATIELKISNVATEEDNYIDITALADATTKENARIKVANNTGGITALLKSGEDATFTITFEVKNDEYKASLNDFSVNFDMQKKVLADFPSYDADSRITIQCDTANKTASVTGNNITEANTEIEIPKYVKNGDVVCGVTSIGEFAFDNCSNLTSITIPNTVTSIGYQAFFCSNLTSIIIPNSVTNIVEEAFFSCTSLKSITISDSVSSIEKGLFYGCNSLESVTIPDTVTSIGGEAFFSCTSLTSITIGNGVTSIGYAAFSMCSNLISIVVESGNSVYDSRNNCNAIIETSTNTLIRGGQNTIIPNTVQAIGECAFNGCSSLTSITIPDSVTSVGDEAFTSCTSLTSITIGNGVTSIGYMAFADCTGLTSITIPDNVTSILDEAFSNCTSLASITIPNSVTNIGDIAFSGCSSLSTVNYRGTQEEWNALLENIGSDNDDLLNATINFI